MRSALGWLVCAALLAACGDDQELALLPTDGGDAGATGGTGGTSGDAGGVGGAGGVGECTGPSQCSGETEFCNVQLGRCVRCLVAGHCESGKACDPAGECRLACSSEAQCASDGKHCDLTLGACVECRPGQSDCTSSDEPLCVLGQCGQCASDAECVLGVKRHCALGECVECLTDGHCDPGQTCDPSEHQCKG